MEVLKIHANPITKVRIIFINIKSLSGLGLEIVQRLHYNFAIDLSLQHGEIDYEAVVKLSDG